MKDIPFDTLALNKLIKFVLRYHEQMLISSIKQNGFWHQGEWVNYEMAYDRSHIKKEKRRYEKEIHAIDRFLKKGIVLFYDKEGYSVIDTNELKYYLQFHHDSIMSWMKVRQTIENPKFKWSQIESDRQQMHYEDSDAAVDLIMNELQIEDIQIIIDMYSFLLYSCSYLVVR